MRVAGLGVPQYKRIMFVRQKRNKSGSISIQVIDKRSGYRVVQTIGSSKDPTELAQYIKMGEAFIVRQQAQLSLFPSDQTHNAAVSDFVSYLNNSQVRTVGPELIFGKLFDSIGFNIIPEQLFRDIVITRLVYPTSKLKTADYLTRYRGTQVSVDTIYRFLDKVSDSYKEAIERVAFEYTKRTLKTVSVVFYDVTTLYFETESEDDLRKIGFSKDGKFQHPQIMLGLLVGQHGYPIGYDLFEGNTFEGHTLLPVLAQIQAKYDLPKPIVVADAAMLSKKNLVALDRAHYKFIVGARIKNESAAVQAEILRCSQHLKHGESFSITREDGHRLVVAFSESRAKKDAYNRERGLRKLKQKVKTGKLTKGHINNRGYNKFLTLTGSIDVWIDERKVEQAAQWDGLKGYLTNTKLPCHVVIENYQELWNVERAFRISKTDLRIRPIHHYKKKRIQAHICIAFVAYTIYKELERRIKEDRLPFSPQRAIELTQTMYALEYLLPGDPHTKTTLLKMDEEQKSLYKLFY